MIILYDWVTTIVQEKYTALTREGSTSDVEKNKRLGKTRSFDKINGLYDLAR
jgi:hypothetical protein